MEGVVEDENLRKIEIRIEIKQVIHRDTVAPKLVIQTDPIYERIVDKPVYKVVELPEADLGLTR
jgi:hypothetical protein